MGRRVFQNTVIFLPVDREKLVPLRFQFLKKTLTVRAVEKEEGSEEESLGLVESFHQYLEKLRIPHRSMTRKTREGKRIDIVVISYERR